MPSLNDRTPTQTPSTMTPRLTCLKWLIPAVALTAGLSACGGSGSSAPRHPYTQTLPNKPKAAGDVFVTSLPAIPGYYLQKSDGQSCSWTSFDGNGDYANGFTKALDSLREQAFKDGDNAVVNVHVSDGTWEAQGSAWRVLMTQFCGDEVVAAKD